MATEDGVINKGFVWLFGANWKTSLSGYITVLAYFVHEQPQVIQWISEPFRTLVWNASEWIFLGGFLAFAQQVKSRGVTGGHVQQDATGRVATPQLPTPPPTEPALPDPSPTAVLPRKTTPRIV